MKIIIAWIKKYILHVHSPSAHARGFEFEYDYLKSLKIKRITELEKENAELYLRISELEAQLEESRSKEGMGVLEKENAELYLRISELEAQLEESRSKEGMGVLENMLDGITKCISSIDFSALMEINHPDLLDDEITIDNDEEE